MPKTARLSFLEWVKIFGRKVITGHKNHISSNTSCALLPSETKSQPLKE